MATRRSVRQAAEVAAEIVEISSDSEPEVTQEKFAEIPKKPENVVVDPTEAHPLMKVEGIRYSSLSTEEIPVPTESANTQPIVERTSSSASAKLPVRVKDTGSVKHRHVSIEIQLPSSSSRSKGVDVYEIPDSDGEGEREVFKTPLERKHINHIDSDNEEFVTPMEVPMGGSLDVDLAMSQAVQSQIKQEEEQKQVEERAQSGDEMQDDASEQEQDNSEDSDDEAPEVVSSHAAAAQIAQASRAAAKAAEQQEAEKKRKRQQRDAFFKQQQTEKKRAQKLVEKAAEADNKLTTEAPESAGLFPAKRKREIPAVLPHDLLDSDSEDEGDQLRTLTTSVSAKKRKLNTPGSTWIAEAKAPKDTRVGRTVYRTVATGGDGNLAPKARKNARTMKHLYQQRGRVAQVKHGFLIKNR